MLLIRVFTCTMFAVMCYCKSYVHCMCVCSPCLLTCYCWCAMHIFFSRVVHMYTAAWLMCEIQHMHMCMSQILVQSLVINFGQLSWNETKYRRSLFGIVHQLPFCFYGFSVKCKLMIHVHNVHVHVHCTSYIVHVHVISPIYIPSPKFLPVHYVVAILYIGMLIDSHPRPEP